MKTAIMSLTESKEEEYGTLWRTGMGELLLLLY